MHLAPTCHCVGCVRYHNDGEVAAFTVAVQCFLLHDIVLCDVHCLWKDILSSTLCGLL
jgi:hypothetical protein